MRPITTFLFLCFFNFSINAQLVEVPILGNPVLQQYSSEIMGIDFRGNDQIMPVNFVADGATTLACVDTFSLNGDFESITCLNCNSANFGTATLNNLCLSYVSSTGNNEVEDVICVEVCTTDGDCSKYIFPFQTRIPFELDSNNPFFDDFSYAGPYPDAAKWLDKDVFVNNTLANNPPSVGFATFDGIDYSGTPYGGGFGLSDQLTTNFIDLSTISNNTVYVSYHVQEKGLGFEPYPGDSLIVEARLDDGTWSTLEIFLPTSSTTVPDAFMPITRTYTNPSFFHRSFQMRFKNYSRRQGAIELWHVDYISIGTVPTINGVYDDIAFTTVPSTFLDRYTAMPWKHFVPVVQNETTDQYVVNITNHFSDQNDVQNTKLNITEINSGVEVTDFVLLSGSQFNLPGNTPNSFDKTIPESVYEAMKNVLLTDNFGNETNLTFQTTYAYNVGNEQDGADGILRNDTVTRLTQFQDYFAYDDGSAEAALVAQNASTRVAVQFKANVSDSLRAVQFHFPRIYDGTETQLLNVQVYVGELDNDPEFDLIFQTPYYVDTDYDSLQGFTNYSLFDFDGNPAPLFVPAGDFYVGWQQVSNSSNAIPVGLDKNNIDATQYGWFSTASEWSPITPGGLIDGAIMIRPVFGDMTPYNTPVNEVTDFTEISVFPNPASDILNIQNVSEKVLDYQILNANGQLVKSGILNGTIDISTLLNGMYFLRLNNDTKGTVTKRFVVVK